MPKESTTSSGYRCKACDTPFRMDTPTNVPVDKWAAFINAMHCPHCGAGVEKLLLGMGLREDEDRALRIQGSEHERAVNWYQRAETGSSSISIFRFFIADHRQDPAYPYDLDDLRRCLWLLEHVPEWKTRISELAVLSSTWARLAPEWNRLTNLFREESPHLNQDAPRARDLLNSLTNPARSTRHENGAQPERKQ